MYNINGYLFDAVRQLLFRDSLPKEVIQSVINLYDKNSPALPFDLELNPDAMSMNTIALNSAGICLSFNCNLRCRYCGYSSDENNPHILKLDDVKVFLRDILRRRTINKLLTKKNEPLDIEITGGGEPTYDWKLFYETIEFLKAICAKNSIPVQIKLTTNGMISEEQADYIAANISHIMVSYDGLPDIQSKNRFSPYEKRSSEIVEKTIRRLVADGASLTIRSTIWQDDFDKMANMYHHVCSLVEPRTDVIWSIYPVLFEGRAINRIQNQKDNTYSYFFRESLELLKSRLIPDVRYNIPIDVALFNNDVHPFFCGAHRATRPWLLPDKSIVSCIESKDDKTYIGKIIDGNVQYNTSYRDPLLKIAQAKYYECQNCIAYSTCKGGCPIWHLRVDEIIQEPLECSLQKDYWHYVVYALTTGEYSLGWRLEKLECPEAAGHEVYKVRKEKTD